LIDELKPAANQILEQLARAARELVENDARWNELSARVAALLAKVPGAHARGDAPAEHTLSSIARDLRRAQRDGLELRSPLPHYAHLRVIEEEHERAKRLKLRRGEGSEAA
jgi:hypothetical protein